MRDKPYFAVVYMFGVTALFSSILIGFSRFTRNRVEANERLALEKAVLEVFPEIPAATNAEIHRVFTEQFVEKQELGCYLYYKNHRLTGYAVPVEGKGFWASIKGIVGVALDKRTITGIAFYEQNETPGLGGRIVEDDFCGQFTGRVIRPGDTMMEIKPAGETLEENQVHAITGATQTCNRLEKLMNDSLSAWLKSMDSAEGRP